MSATEALRAELGIDRIEAKLDHLTDLVEQIQRVKPFHTIDDVRQILGVARREVEAMLRDGRLWTVDGLATSKRLIPQAAIDSLQARPAKRPRPGTKPRCRPVSIHPDYH